MKAIAAITISIIIIIIIIDVYTSFHWDDNNVIDTALTAAEAAETGAYLNIHPLRVNSVYHVTNTVVKNQLEWAQIDC